MDRKQLEEMVENYPNYPEQITRREEFLLNTHAGKDGALRLINDEYRKQLQREYSAVTIALSQSDPKTREIIRLWYMDEEKTTWWQIGSKIGYSRNQSIRKRDDFLMRLDQILKAVP